MPSTLCCREMDMDQKEKMTRDDSNAQPFQKKAPFTRGRLKSLGGMLFLWLLLGVLFGVILLPGWEIRFMGVQTTAVAHADKPCYDDEEEVASTTFSLQFTGTNGERYTLIDPNSCNVYKDGETFSFWYLPDDPTRNIARYGIDVFYLLNALWAMGFMLLLFFSLRRLLGMVHGR
jgi:hypothetical protein